MELRSLLASLLLSFLALSGVSLASEAGEPAIEKVWQGLALHLPDLKVDGVYPTRVPGLYEVVVGPRVIYVTEDARFVFQGDLIDIERKQNLTEPRLRKAKADAVSRVGVEKMLVYEPKEVKHTVTVFTDIDCGFCRKLHREMADYNAAGIRVRYLFYPRAGIDSDSYKKAVSVWCAEDRKDAMTRAKSGEKLDPLECSNPVRQHMQLGEQMGITGTPAMVLESGELLPGYVPADRLIQLLDESAAEG